MSLNKSDAEEFSKSLEQIGEGWFRQLALGIKLGAPEALGRAIADVLGVGETTVRRDVAAPNGALSAIWRKCPTPTQVEAVADMIIACEHLCPAALQ